MSGSDALEKELAKSSVGLVKAEDYKRKREELQMNEVIGKARADQLAQATAEEGKKKKKKKPAKPSGLSFDDELADGEAEVSPNMGNKKMGKSKGVDTSFLRMNSRDAEAFNLGVCYPGHYYKEVSERNQHARRRPPTVILRTADVME